jgi:hypothetical protein
VWTWTRDPPAPSEGAEIELGFVLSSRFFGRSFAHVDGLPQSLNFSASGRIEKLELARLREVLLDLGQVPVGRSRRHTRTRRLDGLGGTLTMSKRN